MKQNVIPQELSTKPTVSEVLPIMYSYRDTEGNGVGGSLHIVLDDGNVNNDDIIWCIEFAKKNKDKAGVELGEILLRMSKTQRKKLCCLFYNAENPLI